MEGPNTFGLPPKRTPGSILRSQVTCSARSMQQAPASTLAALACTIIQSFHITQIKTDKKLWKKQRLARDYTYYILHHASKWWNKSILQMFFWQHHDRLLGLYPATHLSYGQVVMLHLNCASFLWLYHYATYQVWCKLTYTVCCISTACQSETAMTGFAC